MRTFYIKQKIFTLRDRYYVYDGHKQPVYEVTGKFFSIGDELTISDLNGNPLFRIKQRVMSFFGAYDVYQNDILCATIKRRATFLMLKVIMVSSKFMGTFGIMISRSRKMVIRWELSKKNGSHSVIAIN
jgi:uncharacterized protein YxjI